MPRGVGHTPRACPALAPADRAPPVLADAAGVPLDLTRDSPRRLVTPFVAWFLSGGMPSEWRGAWRRLFDSDVDGLSFQTFLSRVVDQGPALVAVRTRAGDVLGGVSSESLTSKPEFFGDARSFVFALGRAEPDRSVDGDPPAEVGAHPASGRNENFAWCASDSPPERFPNGVGFGGQVGHHSVWIDAIRKLALAFVRGDVRSASAPIRGDLTGAFRVDAIEAWGLAAARARTGFASARRRGWCPRGETRGGEDADGDGAPGRGRTRTTGAVRVVGQGNGTRYSH